MKRPHAEEILGEWGIRDVTPPSQREREELAADSELNPLVGRRLRRRLRNFRPDPDSYIASLGGPLPYMQRLRQIEALTREHLARLEEAYAERGPDWRQIAARWDFGDVNDLIERHNRWYPVEARLAMSPRTGDFVPVGGRSYRLEPLGAAWVLAGFPPRGSERPAA